MIFSDELARIMRSAGYVCRASRSDAVCVDDGGNANFLGNSCVATKQANSKDAAKIAATPCNCDQHPHGSLIISTTDG